MLPIAAVVVDRVVGFVVRRAGVRFAARARRRRSSAALLWHQWSPPLSTAPLDRPGDDGRGARGRARRDPDLDGHDACGPHVDVRLRARDLAASDGASPRTRSTSSARARRRSGRFPATPRCSPACTRAVTARTTPAAGTPARSIYGRRRVLPLADDKTTLAEVLHGARLRDRRLRREFREPRPWLRHGAGVPALRGPARTAAAPGAARRRGSCSASGRRTARSRSAAPTRSTPPRSRGWIAWRHDRPAFVFLNYLEPHHWLAAPPYDLWARDLPDAQRLALKGLFTHAVPAGLEQGRARLRRRQLRRADPRDGRGARSLFDELKKRGRYENALIIVTADHGELLGEHDIVGHGGRMMYEGLLHIPLVVKFPGADRPRGVGRRRRCSSSTSCRPSLQTIGAPLPSRRPRRAAAARRSPRDSPRSTSIPSSSRILGEVYNRALRAIYDGPYKLITTSRGERFLFDLANDPDESEGPRVARSPTAWPRMEEELDAAMSAMDPKVASAIPIPDERFPASAPPKPQESAPMSLATLDHESAERAEAAPRISVVMPVYNAEKLLDECLARAARQRRRRLRDHRRRRQLDGPLARDRCRARLPRRPERRPPRTRGRAQRRRARGDRRHPLLRRLGRDGPSGHPAPAARAFDDDRRSTA